MLKQFSLPIELPAPTVLSFSKTWAAGVMSKSRNIPRYSNEGAILRNLHYAIGEAVRTNQSPTPIDKEALDITVARLIDKLSKQPVTFSPSFCIMQKPDGKLHLIPCSLVTLIFMVGEDPVPAKYWKLRESYEGAEYVYRFISPASYSVRKK